MKTWTMARPRAEFPPAEAIRALADGEGRLAVRVTPGARSEGIAIEDGRLLVKVRVKPEDGKATAAVLDLVAQALGVAASRIALLRGAASRDKWVRIPPAAVDAFEKNMKEAGKNLVVNRYDAAHGFANPSNPVYNKAATEDAHIKTIAFLKAHM